MIHHADGAAQAGVRRIVQRGCAVIEDEHLRLFDERARDGQALALAAGEIAAALLDGLVQMQGLAGDDVERLRDGERLVQIFLRGAFVAPEEVGADGALEEHGLLRDDGDGLSQLLLVDSAHVRAADQNAALGRVVEAGNEVHQRGLAAACAADDADGLAGADAEGDMLQGFRAGALVMQGDVLKGDAARFIDRFGSGALGGGD